MHIPLSEEYALPQQFHLLQVEHHTWLGLILVWIEPVVLTARCNSNPRLLGPIYNNKLPRFLPLAMLNGTGHCLQRTILPSDQKPSIRLRYQEHLGKKVPPCTSLPKAVEPAYSTVPDTYHTSKFPVSPCALPKASLQTCVTHYPPLTPYYPGPE